MQCVRGRGQEGLKHSTSTIRIMAGIGGQTLVGHQRLICGKCK